VTALNATPIAYPGSPLHLNVEFCANPPAHAARWLHGDRVFTPGNQYGSTVLAYAVKVSDGAEVVHDGNVIDSPHPQDLPTPFCKEARLTYVSMHERVPRTFYFVVSTPGGVAEAVFNVNFTKRHRQLSNSIDDDEEEELNQPEQIHFPVFNGSPANGLGWWAVVLALVLAPIFRNSH